MRIQRNKKKSKLLAYLPVLIVMLSLTIITVSTFAFFTDKGGASATVNFGKVELSDGTSAGVTRTLFDTMPGDAIIEDTLSFSKSSDSEDIFVRAKLSFSTDSTDETVAEFLSTLRGFDASDFGISNTEIGTTGAKWSAKTGNYVYLVNADDETTLFNVTSDITYTLSNSIIVPTELTQSVDEDGDSTFAHYMESIKFNFAFQAVQSNNVDDILVTTSETFNEAFPESVGEAIPEETEIYDFIFSENSVMSYTGTDTEIVIPSSYNILEYEIHEMLFSELDYSVTIGEMFLPLTIIAYNTEEGGSFIDYEFEVEDDFYVFPYAFSAVSVKFLLPIYGSGDDYQVTRIATYAFQDCYNLTSITIPDSVTSIGNAFLGCCNLKSITIPSGVMQIGSSAFNNCFKLVHITNLSSVAFNSSSFGLPVNVGQEIRTDMNTNFVNTLSSENGHIIYVVGSEIYYIGYEGTSTILIIPNDVKGIYPYAFYNAFNVNNLTTITIPSSVTSIGTNAFDNCHKLVHITNLSSVVFSSGSFGLPTNVGQEIRTDTNFVNTLSSENGNITLVVGSEIYYMGYEGMSTTIVIPSNVTQIYKYALNGCNSMTTIMIPQSVTIIEIGAFQSCSSLTTVNYVGTEALWGQITIGSSNTPLTNATKVYNYVG